MKRRPVSVIIAIVLILWLPLTMWIYGSLGHRALEAYVGELRTKGEKLTLRELHGPISTFERLDNWLAVFTNTVQLLGEPPGGWTNITVMQFVDAGRARIAWRENAPPWVPSGDTTNGTWVAISNHLAQRATRLRELSEAAKQPATRADLRTNWFAPPPGLYRTVRPAVTWLANEALLALHENRKEDALANIQAISGLVKLHKEEYVFASQMLRVTVGGVGLGLTWEALQANGWDRQQLLMLQQCWEGLDFLEALEMGLKGERSLPMEILGALRGSKWRLESIQGIAERSSSRPGTERLATQKILRWGLRTLAERDLLMMLREGQTEVELVRSLRANRPWKEAVGSLEKLVARIERLSVSRRRFLYLFTVIGLSNMTPAFRAAVRAETGRRLTITAIALKRFELETGHCPPTLEALVPAYLHAVPLDCMSGEVLRYRMNGDNTYTLYSVGEDGKDDGGDATTAKPNANPGLWEGRDAVWPLATLTESASSR